MKRMDAYFKKFADRISFIEIKEGSYVDVNGYLICSDIPLPILTNKLAKEIKSGTASEELKIHHIVDGMIYMLGVDRCFKYLEEYKKVLYHYDENIEHYIFYKGFKKMEMKDYKNAAILFRALIVLNGNNVESMFNYGLCLEGIARSKDTKQGERFLLEATKVFETILDKDSKFSLAYYKLGYYYKYLGQFLKAKLVWEKFILLDKDAQRIQEIREALDNIEHDVEYEEGVRLMLEGKYYDAIVRFTKLKDKYKTSWNINYMLGLSYKGLGMEEKAINCFKQTLDLNPKESDVYNDVGISLFELSKFQDAIEVFTKGIKMNKKDFKIVFNRGLTYLQLGKYELAKKDIDSAYNLSPQNEMVVKQKEVLDSLLEGKN